MKETDEEAIDFFLLNLILNHAYCMREREIIKLILMHKKLPQSSVDFFLLLTLVKHITGEEKGKSYAYDAIIRDYNTLLDQIAEMTCLLKSCYISPSLVLLTFW